MLMKANFSKFLSVLIMIIWANSRNFATTITSVKCGTWTDSLTWDLNRIPVSTDTILVRHFVSFDTNFKSESPGLLHVETEGELCGLKKYEGHFISEGRVYLSELVISYGQSANYSVLNVLNAIRILGGGYSFRQQACVGCSVICQSCSAISIPKPIIVEPIIEENKDSVVKPMCEVTFPNLLIRGGQEMNQYFFSDCSSSIHFLNLSVFNRWGKLVYEGDDGKPPWNGEDNSGISLSDGTYFYKFSYEYLPPVTITSTPSLTGWVELMTVR